MIDGSGGWPDEARHVLRIGALNDKAIVEAEQATFDVISVQANLAVSARKGLASWLALKVPFWIDPIAYAFCAAPAYLKSEQKLERGKPEKKLKFKRTFQQLADEYGEPFKRVIEEDRALTPEDFDPLDDEALATRLLEWQRTIFQLPETDQKFLEDAAMEPVLLTVPFFPLMHSDNFSDPPVWLDLNLRLAHAATNTGIVKPDRLAVGVLVSDGLFDDPAFETYWASYLALPVKHLWLWISENDEVEMSATRAQRLRAAILAAKEAGKEVHQAFGGSFSSLLLKDGLRSVGHGLAYWEHKNWEPLAGGGVPTLRYFYPPLGRRLRFLDADSVVGALPIDTADEFHETVCGCDVCRGVLDGDIRNFARYGEVEVRSRVDRFNNVIEYDVPVAAAMRASKHHYLQAKRNEIELALSMPLEQRALALEAIAALHDGVPMSIQHLRRWRAALLNP